MKKTLVLQSYRTTDVPEWISVCLESVRQWAELSGFDYEFLGDEFFDFAPDWIREKCADHFYPVTDIARLHLLKQRLAGDYERVVWLDADVVIFDPEAFSVEAEHGYAFSHEVVFGNLRDGKIEVGRNRLNNAVMVFDEDNPMLDFYRFASEEILRKLDVEKFSRIMIGPGLLIALDKAMPLERLTCVGLFNMIVIQALAVGDRQIPRHYRREFGHHIAGANMCHFIVREESGKARDKANEVCLKAVSRLLETRGDIINVP